MNWIQIVTESYEHPLMAKLKKLSDKELAALGLILSFKSFARKDELERVYNNLKPNFQINYDEYQQLIPALVKNGILKNNQNFVFDPKETSQVFKEFIQNEKNVYPSQGLRWACK